MHKSEYDIMLMADLVEYASDMIQCVNSRGEFLYVNKAWLNKLGYRHEELRQLTLWHIIHPDSIEHCKDVFYQVMQGKQVDCVEATFVAKDGRSVLVEGSANCRLDEQGIIIGTRGIFRDVTRHKADKTDMDRNLRTSQQQLKAEKQKLSDTIAATQAGTWEWHVPTGETILNERWAEIIGYALPELESTTIETWRRFVHPDDLRQAAAELEQVFSGVKAYYAIDVRMKHKNGNWLWVADRGKVVTRDESGKPLWLFGTLIDITETKSQAVALQRILETSRYLLELHEETIDYQRITDDFSSLCGGKLVAFNLYERDGRHFRTKAIAGEQTIVEKVFQLLPFRLKDKLWAYDPVREAKIGRGFMTRFASIEDLSGDVLPQHLIRLLQNLFKTGDVIVMNILYQDKMLGDFTLILPKGKTFNQEELAAIFCNQLGVSLERQRAELELRAAQEALEQSEQKFRSLYENAPMSVIIHDKDSGEILDANKMAYQLYGFDSLEEMKTREIWSAHPYSEKEALEWIKKAGTTGPQAFEWHSRKVDGTNVWEQVRLTPVQIGDKQRVIAASIDVTDLKKAHDEISTSRDLLQNVLASMQDGIYVLSSDLTVQHANPMMMTWFQDEHTLIGTKCYTAFLGREGPCENCPVVRSLSSGTVESDERWTMTHVGMKCLQINSYPIRDLQDYNKINGIVASVRDITERKQMETQLHVEKEQFRTTLLSVGDAIIATDIAGQITVMNPIAEKLTGWTQQEAQGLSAEKVFRIIHEQTREACVNPVERAMQTGETVELSNHTLLLARNHSEIPIEDSAAPIRDADGSITGAVLVFRDFSDKKEKMKEIEYLSFHDHLTGLYNRRYIEDSLTRLDTKRNVPFAVIAVDVNGLKLTNDAFGHKVGDQLLQSVAAIMKKVCRNDDIIGRMGGDEFIVLLPKTHEEQAGMIMRRIVDEASVIQLDSAVVSLAVGCAVKADALEKMTDVLLTADHNMYKNKLKYGKVMRIQTIETVLRNINMKFAQERIHTESVSQHCAAIGTAIGFNDKEVDNVRTAGLLHDIGKIMIPSELLKKPDRLTDKEFVIIRKHPETSHQILKAVDEYAVFAEDVLYHHERVDGNGYPEGLKADAIPLNARIIAVADAYEAMTADHPYHKKKTKAEAITELWRCAGTQFDKTIVRVFVEQVLQENQ